MEGLLQIGKSQSQRKSPILIFLRKLVINVVKLGVSLQLNVILDELEVSSLDEPVAYEKFLDESNS